jgi:hypothetical protein
VKEPKEMVNHPDHYKGHNIEVIDIIEDFDLGFSLGNIIKYVLRADSKGNDVQDLEKALWYLRRELDNRGVKQNEEIGKTA